MASSIMALSSTAAVAAVAAPPKTSNGNGSSNGNVVSAFTGLKSTAQFPSSMKISNAGAEWERKTTSNGGRVRCMQVWPPYNNPKFETLSYLPRLTQEQLLKEVLNEVNECAKAYPKAFIRVIGFDNVRQVQCISFIVHKPEYN
uniref:Ribulose bisphosphate carboxylase small subunit n=1 Tax=Picea sitchensis TaxID=3332 RepID=B8LN69_PICSI|nr:unknown [Picea sitchensis]